MLNFKLRYLVLALSVMLALPIATAISKVHRGAKCRAETSTITSVDQLKELQLLCR